MCALLYIEFYICNLYIICYTCVAIRRYTYSMCVDRFRVRWTNEEKAAAIATTTTTAAAASGQREKKVHFWYDWERVNRRKQEQQHSNENCLHFCPFIQWSSSKWARIKWKRKIPKKNTKQKSYYNFEFFTFFSSLLCSHLSTAFMYLHIHCIHNHWVCFLKLSAIQQPNWHICEKRSWIRVKYCSIVHVIAVLVVQKH